MGLSDYLILGVIFLFLAVLLYIPCHWLIKRKIINIDPGSDYMLRVTSSGLALCTLMVVALILGFTQEHLSPESKFGMFIDSWSGKFYYIMLVNIVTVIFGLILNKLGFTLFKRPDNDGE